MHITLNSGLIYGKVFNDMANAKGKEEEFILKVSRKSAHEIQQLARNLNETPAGVMSQALALLQMVQGKTVILKEKNKRVNIKISNYAERPAIKGRK